MGATSATFDQFANSLIASGDPYAMAAGAAVKTINRIVATLGIGTGRMEADRIVPYQNALADLLDTANQAMGNAGVSAQRLIEIKRAVVESGDEFRAYINDRQQFPDGRASSQANATMFGQPGYLRVTVENLDKEISLRGGGVLASITGGAGSNSLFLVFGGLGLVAVLLFRK